MEAECDQLMQKRLRAAVREGFGRVRQQVEAGQDVAPLERGRLEGLLTALLITGSETPERIADWCRPLLPPASQISIVSKRGTLCVQLDIWQQRAPVTPSTSEQ